MPTDSQQSVSSSLADTVVLSSLESTQSIGLAGVSEWDTSEDEEAPISHSYIEPYTPSVYHNVPIATIKFKDSATRQFFVIDGQPFYISSGLNSNNPGTAFAFHGFRTTWSTADKPYGYLNKSYGVLSINYVPKDEKVKGILQSIADRHPNFKYLLRTRFGSLFELGVSAAFGGTLWSTEDGKTVRAKLMQALEGFFWFGRFGINHIDTDVVFDCSDKVYESEEYLAELKRANAWLTSMGATKLDWSTESEVDFYRIEAEQAEHFAQQDRRNTLVPL